MPSSTCTFTNDRDEELAARLEEPNGPTLATAIFAHCFTCSKDLRAARRLARALAARGIAVLSFDFAGLGSSDGDFAATTFSTDVDDLLSAAAYLTESHMAPTLLVGHSLGGAAVLTAAARLDSVVAVATIGAPSDVEHVTNVFKDDLDTIKEKGEATVTIVGREFTLRSSFVEDLAAQRLTETVHNLRAATLFLHGPLDNTVGIRNAGELFAAAKHPKSFVSLDNADHLLSNDADARYAAEVIAAWAARYLPDVDAAASAPDAPAAVTPNGGSYDDATVSSLTTEGLRAEVSTRGFTMIVDEPESSGGTETGPTPYEYLGAALASCTSLTLRMYADRKKLALDEVLVAVDFAAVHADDCADCEHGAGRIEQFTRTITLKGDLTDDERASLIKIADRCPVHKTLEGQIEIRTRAAE